MPNMVAVLKLDVQCERCKQKVMATVCRLSGVSSVDVTDGKLTVKGREIDASMIVKKLKKICHTEIISVGPVKEPEPDDDKKPPEVIYIYYMPDDDMSYRDYTYYVNNFNGCCFDENPNACVIV